MDFGSFLTITTNTPSASVQAADFSLGLIISKNTVITTLERVRIFNSAAELIAAGFASDSAEVNAANFYFGQNPSPAQLAVGVQAATGETCLQALTLCRQTNIQWFAGVFLGAVKADVVAMAAYAETASPSMALFYTTADADILTGTAGNVGLTLKTAKYKMTFGMYSTTVDAAVAVMGYVCGISKSASFDLKFKSLVGVASEALTATQVVNITAANLNFYTTYLGSYTFLANGVTASGAHVDEIIGINVLQAAIQSGIMSVLTSNTKVPLTDTGMSIITTEIAKACEQSRVMGFIAAGTWAGGTVLGLKNGDALPNGYSIQAESASTLSLTDRANRSAPDVYVCITLAGSGESFAINVNVQE